MRIFDLAWPVALAGLSVMRGNALQLCRHSLASPAPRRDRGFVTTVQLLRSGRARSSPRTRDRSATDAVGDSVVPWAACGRSGEGDRVACACRRSDLRRGQQERTQDGSLRSAAARSFTRQARAALDRQRLTPVRGASGARRAASRAVPRRGRRIATGTIGVPVRSRASLGSSPLGVPGSRPATRCTTGVAVRDRAAACGTHGASGYCVHVPGSAAEHRRSQVRNGAGTSITIQGFSGRVRPAWPARHAEMWHRGRIRGRMPERVALSAVSHLHMQHPWASR